MIQFIIGLIIGLVIGFVIGFAVIALFAANDEPYEIIEAAKVSKTNKAGE